MAVYQLRLRLSPTVKDDLKGHKTMGFDVYIDIDGKAKDEAQARLIVDALEEALSSFPGVGTTAVTRSDGTTYTPPPYEAEIIDTAFNGPGVDAGDFWMRYQG